MLAYLSGICAFVIRYLVHRMCMQLKTWVFCIGFTLSFGAMFSKTWRVHSIFTNIQLNKKVCDSANFSVSFRQQSWKIFLIRPV